MLWFENGKHDVALVDKSIFDQAKQLTNLWKEGIVENVYFDHQSKSDGFENYPGISFFLKAPSEAKTKKLDEIDLCEKRHFRTRYLSGWP